MLKEIVSNIDESAVGKAGRTGRVDAELFVEQNPELIKEFMKVVNKLGGKAVASALLKSKAIKPTNEQE